jgi:hypothetical protein
MDLIQSVPLYINIVAIILEITGFIKMLRTTKKAIQMGGGFDDGYRDEETKKDIDNILYIKDKKGYFDGIYMIIGGLGGQVFATILQLS